jgi:hypothetical protein
MRQTKGTRWFGLRQALMMVLSLLWLGSSLLFAQEVSFQDLPKDHWAFQDVQFLISQGYMDGFPDGTFKGRKVMTRYDAALILARMMKKIEDKVKGEKELTDGEKAALSRLTKEFKDELGLLGIRVDTLERRMDSTETRVKAVEDVLPKVKVSGFYRGRGQFIFEPETVRRNEYGDEASFTKPGLVTFYQQVYLRFTGKPMGERIETFFELLGYISGRNWNQIVYNDYGKTGGKNPFDKIDDYVDKINWDRYAQSNKIHFVSNAKSMKIRVFAGESVTGIDDPLNMMTEDTGVVEPYQGIEFSGADRGLSYQAAVLKNDMAYWNRQKGDTEKDEIIAGRMVWKLPAKFSKDALSVGTSFAEKVHDYTIRGNSNTVRGVDVGYSTERLGKTTVSAEFLTSTDYHTDTQDDQKRSLGDEGVKFDASLANGGFTGTVKHYDFGREFRALMAPVWAFDIGDADDDNHYPYVPIYKKNYGHEGFYGEKLTRFSLNYDFGEKLLAIAKNLSVEGTYLSKTWEVDPFKPQKTDGYSGRKYTFQLLSDFTDNTTLKYDFEHRFDAFENEQGALKNTLELNLKLTDSVSAKGKVYVLNDHDEVDVKDGTTHKRNEQDGYFEVSSNINPRVYAKGSVEHFVNWVNAPKQYTKVDYIGETTYNLTPTTSLTGGVQHLDIENNEEPAKSNLTNAVLAELKKNFTNKFRGKATYARAVVDYKDGATDTLDRENIYGELIYDISKDASFKLKFGYDYPDDGRWDISNLDKDITTQKYMLFEAKTNF